MLDGNVRGLLYRQHHPMCVQQSQLHSEGSMLFLSFTRLDGDGNRITGIVGLYMLRCDLKECCDQRYALVPGKRNHRQQKKKDRERNRCFLLRWPAVTCFKPHQTACSARTALTQATSGACACNARSPSKRPRSFLSRTRSPSSGSTIPQLAFIGAYEGPSYSLT